MVKIVIILLWIQTWVTGVDHHANYNDNSHIEFVISETLELKIILGSAALFHKRYLSGCCRPGIQGRGKNLALLTARPECLYRSSYRRRAMFK